jgi:hypothetical protein
MSAGREEQRGRLGVLATGRRVLAAAALLLALAATSSPAELAQRGNLFVRFDGGVSPRALPRQRPAPISVRIEGTVSAPHGDEPPALRGIEIALNRAGKLSTAGLPTCRRNRIATSTTGEALAACGSALVGSGGIVARTSIADDQAARTIRAEVLLFNGQDHSKPAILAHVYQAQPIPITRIIAFKIQRQGGTFGTVITASLPPALNSNGYLKSIFLQLERRYRFHGQERSYLSAACSAPPGFAEARFPFAKTSMTFEDGRTVTSTLVRSCKVAKASR